MNIYVGNLSYNISEDELKKVFETYGPVETSRIVMDRETGRSRGFAFVTMGDESGEKAIEALNGAEVGGRTLKVNQAIDKPQSSRQRKPAHQSNGRRPRFE